MTLHRKAIVDSRFMLPILMVCFVACAPIQTDSIPPTNKQVGNSMGEPTSAETSTPVIETRSLPDYLNEVWPEPGSTMSETIYSESLSDGPIQVGATGIGVVFLSHRIAQAGDVDIKWVARCFVLVDGESVSDDIWLVENGLVLNEKKDEQGNVVFRVSDPYYISWLVPLDPGTHTATFQVHRTTGEVLEYSWEFEVVP